MSQLRITAVTGLRTEGEVNSSWADFYTDHKQQKQKAGDEETAKIPVENEMTYDDDFEDMDDDDEDKSRETPRINLNLTHSSSERLDETDSQSSSSGKPRKKGKVKKFKKVSNNKPPALQLYQDQVREHLRYSRERTSSFNQDTLSDQEVRRRRGRKLHRRGQMKKYHSLEQAVEQAGQDRLEQKYVELEELITKPLVDGRKAHVPAQQAKWTSKKQQKQQQHHHAKPGLREEESGPRMSAWISNSTLDEEDGATERQAYSTLHKLQTTNSAPRKQQKSNTSQPTASGSENNSHQSRQNSRLTSKPPVPRRQKCSEDSVPNTNSEASDLKNDSDSKPQENGLDLHLPQEEEEDEDDKFGNVSPRSVYLPAEMHLKYTDNPKLQEWLRRKNIEHRQARKAERAKKREERLEKQVEQEKKEVRREKSSERVKQWMDMKRKEAAKQQKEERRRRRQEAQEEAALRAKAAENGIGGSRLDRPQSAPSSNKKHTPIKRPESAARLENGAYMAPKPPDTKFVYKRPVSGKVRLMKLQNEKNAKARNAEKKVEELSPEEKEKKMRLSYDAWLIAKRKEDVEKHKEAKRQEHLIRSDPEMDRLVPELAIRRIEKINTEKKTIDTGVSLIDDDVNKRFGGGSFGKEKEKQSLKHDHDSVPEPSSYTVVGEESGSSLAELNSRSRPTVAKTHMPIPQSALSPRRPQSAKPSRDSSPKVRAIMDTDHMTEPNPFKSPFSDDFGASWHARHQERISSKHSSSRSKDSCRPEPQGCISVEPSSCPKDADSSFPKGVDSSPKTETTPRSSLVLLQQIEAAAVQSEQNASGSSAEQSPNSKQDEIPKEVFITEGVPSTGNAKCNAGNDDGKTVEKSDDQPEQTQVDNSEKTTEHQQENPSSEQRSSQELAEPDAAHEQQKQAVENREKQIPEKQLTASEPDGPEEENMNNLAGGDNMQEPQSSQAEDSPGRSMKRVSFSEDLATVFQSSSPETSSNFEDERGVEDEEGDPYMSLDDAPDPDHV